jgi:hypothetical protein
MKFILRIPDSLLQLQVLVLEPVASYEHRAATGMLPRWFENIPSTLKP